MQRHAYVPIPSVPPFMLACVWPLIPLQGREFGGVVHKPAESPQSLDLITAVRDVVLISLVCFDYFERIKWILFTEIKTLQVFTAFRPIE